MSARTFSTGEKKFACHPMKHHEALPFFLRLNALTLK